MLSFFKRKPKKVTLVLGGGGARGLAHIGILKVLEKEDIQVDLVVGTSMGAVVGAAYCLGISTAEMEEKANKISPKDLLDPTIPTMGLIEGKKMEDMINELLEHKDFSDLKVPLAVVTTDIEKAQEVVYTSGPLAKIVRASCSWPGIFAPVEYEGRLLVDGGIKNSVPVAIARQLGADFIIACDVGFCVTKDVKIRNIMRLILQSFQIMGEELNTYQSKQADIVIEPDLDYIDQAAFDRLEDAIQSGQKAAEAILSNIRGLLRIRKKR